MKILIKHLTAEEIIHIHNRSVEAFGGLPGLVSPERVDALTARVANLSEYEGIHDLHALGAMYCIAIARGHVFPDGNKRTALNTAALFFLKNGIRLQSVPGLDDIIVKTAAGKMLLPELTEYFRNIPKTVMDSRTGA